MSVSKLLLRDKMLEIIDFCDMDVKDIRLYLISYFKLPQNIDLSRELKKFKQLIAEITQEQAKSDYVAEYIRKFEVKVK